MQKIVKSSCTDMSIISFIRCNHYKIVNVKVFVAPVFSIKCRCLAWKENILAKKASILACSVTRCGKILPFWLLFSSLAKNWRFYTDWQIFGWLFYALGIFCENFFEIWTKPSGRTYSLGRSDGKFKSRIWLCAVIDQSWSLTKDMWLMTSVNSSVK